MATLLRFKRLPSANDVRAPAGSCRCTVLQTEPFAACSSVARPVCVRDRVIRCKAVFPEPASAVDAQPHVVQHLSQQTTRCSANHSQLVQRTAYCSHPEVLHIQSSYTTNGRSGCSTSRRQLILHSCLAPLLVPLVIGSDDATTIVNSVLSAYGLPTFKASAGFKLYDEFDDDFTFEYPRSWVARPNSLRKGVYISDFQTADKVSVEELDLPADGDIATAAVAAAVYPGGNRLVEDATLTLPAKRLIKAATETVDGQEIMYLEFPSETITRSGYNIRRKNFAAAAVKRDKLYTIAASSRSDQFNDDKKQLLQHIVQSFRLR